MKNLIDVNAHMHTPYSFSAFADVDQALDMATSEGVKVVGINDFYSLDGYSEWSAGCKARNLCPMFNIEFISLNSEDQAAGLRVNDPNNPGRTYISGKGLSFPIVLKGREEKLLEDIRNESNMQVERMCAKLNAHLDAVGSGFNLDFKRIVKDLTKGSVRERHLAKAVRMEVEARFIDVVPVYEKLFGGVPLKASPDNAAAVENEIRSRLLKAGGAAFVPEDPKAFLPIEFITTRNTTRVLEEYASYLEDEGFTVTFGSEHNTPALEPIRLRTSDHPEGLSEKLREINFRGACKVVAHQAGTDSADAGEEIIMNTINA